MSVTFNQIELIGFHSPLKCSCTCKHSCNAVQCSNECVFFPSCLLQSSSGRLTCALCGVQAARQLLQESRPGRVPAVLLALVVLLRHQRVVEPGAAQAAVLSRLPAAVAAHHRRRPGHVGVGRRAGAGVCRNRGGWGAIWGRFAEERGGGENTGLYSQPFRCK